MWIIINQCVETISTKAPDLYFSLNKINIFEVTFMKNAIFLTIQPSPSLDVIYGRLLINFSRGFEECINKKRMVQ